ncbi:MAG: hypothetical protein K9L30_09975 [Desulfobacterales bacterium]|nr:hypothetical protein [Desulfobacterales bacterium]
MKKLLLLITCVTFIIGLALPASAAELGVRGYYWFPSLDGSLRVDEAGITGTMLDIEDDLGMDDDNFPMLEAFAGLGNHHLSFTYYSLEFDGDNTLTRSINFKGRTYSANDDIVSELSFDSYDFMYRYDLIDLENWLAGFSLGLVGRVTIFDGSASVVSSTISEQEDFTLPLPMVGANLHIGILKDFLEARALLTGISYSGDSAYDGMLELSLTPFPFLDIHAGYRTIIVDFDEDDVLVDFDISGPYAAVTVSF